MAVNFRLSLRIVGNLGELGVLRHLTCRCGELSVEVSLLTTAEQRVLWFMPNSRVVSGTGRWAP
jgi:hypothetical protein